MNFSLLVPTRARPHNVARLLDSIATTADNPSAIEVVLYVDDDDRQSHHLTHDTLKTESIVGDRRPMSKMFSACYQRCSGAIIMLCGDDVVFRTAGWDQQVAARFERFPDRIALIYGNDLLKGESLCTHPFLSREACEQLGRPCPPEYPGEYIDTHIFDVFHKLRCAGRDRIVYLDDVVIEHMHYSVGKAPVDDTYTNHAPTHICREIYERLEGQRAQTVATLLATTQV